MQGSTCCSWRSATVRMEWHDKPNTCRPKTGAAHVTHKGRLYYCCRPCTTKLCCPAQDQHSRYTWLWRMQSPVSSLSLSRHCRLRTACSQFQNGAGSLFLYRCAQMYQVCMQRPTLALTSSLRCRRSTACRQVHHNDACWCLADNSSLHRGGSCSGGRHRRHCNIAALATPAALGTCRGASALLSLKPWSPRWLPHAGRRT